MRICTVCGVLLLFCKFDMWIKYLNGSFVSHFEISHFFLNSVIEKYTSPIGHVQNSNIVLVSVISSMKNKFYHYNLMRLFSLLYFEEYVVLTKINGTKAPTSVFFK